MAGDESTARFTRRIESFNCDRCGATIDGDGYTNHCPKCLWSRHVDIHPGDRANPCRSAMRPIAILSSRRGWRVVHQCLGCGEQRTVNAAEADDPDVLREIAASAASNPPRLNGRGKTGRNR